MKRKLNTHYPLYALLFALFSPLSMATPFDDAVVAYDNKDYSTAYEIWSRLAEQDDSNSQFALGVMLFTGNGQKKDEEQAFKWFSKASENGHVAAMFNLGIAYWDGQGTAVDTNEALHWWRKAAERGDRIAQYNLGTAYYNGNRIAKNLTEAAHWIRSSADQDYHLANALLPKLEEDLRKATPVVAEVEIQPANDSHNNQDTQSTETTSSPDTTNSSDTETAENDDNTVIADANFVAGIVKLADAPVYADKNNTSPVIEKLADGTAVKVLTQTDSWSKVSAAKGFRVWIYGKYVTGEGTDAKVAGKGVRVRPLPSTADNSPPLGTLENDTKVTLLKSEGKWKFIQAPSSLGAWIKTKHLAIQEQPTVAWMKRWEQ